MSRIRGRERRRVAPIRSAGVLWLALGVLGCDSLELDRALHSIDGSSIGAHLTFLSSDLLEGRAAGSRGAGLAADYIANQFALSGLEPIGEDDFFQPVPLLATRYSGSISFRARGGAALESTLGEDLVAWSNVDSGRVSVAGELVFVGSRSGTTLSGESEEPEHPLRGNVALVILPPPGGSRLEEAAATGGIEPEWRRLVERVTKAGAVGILIVHTRETTGLPWRVIRDSWSGERLRLAGERRAVREPGVVAWVRRETAAQLVSMAGLDFETLLEMAVSPGFEPIATGVAVRSRVEVSTRESQGLNVGAWLRGRQPRDPQETIILAANYDGLGVAVGGGGDSVFNGAYDNAGGVALLLNLTEAFARLDRPPARSVLFLALTGGESGGLGAKRYLQDPLVPLDRTVAALVLEGANLWGRTEDVALRVVRGEGLRWLAERAASAEDMRLAPNVRDPRRRLFVSDVDRFAAAGITAAVLSNGWEFLGHLPGWGARLREGYYQDRYRGPGDEYLPSQDLGGGVQQGRVALRLAHRLAETGPYPASGR